MIKKLSLGLLAISAGFAASCTNPFYVNSVRRAENWQPRIELPSSVVVCRQKQCAPAKLSMSKEYIYNSLLHLLDNNSQNKALVCRADPSSHICTENYLTVPVTVGVTPANMYIDDVKITDVSASIGNKSLNVILNYNVTYNGQTPTCKPARSLVYVKNTNNIILEDSGYICKMTTIGNTTIKTLFAIDYIDLDYGYIGGYYSIGLSGPAFGGDSGYMMLRLPQDAYPLSPELILKEEPEPEPEPEVKEEPKPEEPAPAAQNVNPMQPMPVIVDINGVPTAVQIDANGIPVALPNGAIQMPMPMQVMPNGMPIQMQMPMPMAVGVNGVPAQAVPVNTNGVPVPMTIDANGNPVPVVFDENGKPIVLQMSHTVELNNPFAANSVQPQQEPEVKEEPKKVKKKKRKVKAKNSRNIETSVTTRIVSMEERQNLVSQPEEKVAPKPVTSNYEGVKVFPLPMKKKDTGTTATKTSNLKDEIADKADK